MAVEDDKIPSSMSFRPRRFPYSNVVIDGHSGYISLQALHWLSRNKIPVFVMSFDGTLISSILPPMPVKADLRAAQIQAANDVAEEEVHDSQSPSPGEDCEESAGSGLAW